MPSDYERIKNAIAFIEQNAASQPSLAAVAKRVGISPAYLQRVFRRWAGVSPKRFLQFVTAGEAKRLLRDCKPVLDAAFAVGLSGPSRLHDLMVSVEAVTPGEYAAMGQGLTIRYGVHDSPFGRCVIAATPRGICAMRFADDQEAREEIDAIAREWPHASLVRDQRSTAPLARAVFEGRGASSLLLVLKGTNFQLKVWEALLRLPGRSAVSYQDLAHRIGSPRATRAVANAVAANPIGYLIPCHRVLRASGSLGGYQWGEERKAVMLAREIIAAESPVFTNQKRRGVEQPR